MLLLRAQAIMQNQGSDVAQAAARQPRQTLDALQVVLSRARFKE